MKAPNFGSRKLVVLVLFIMVVAGGMIAYWEANSKDNQKVQEEYRTPEQKIDFATAPAQEILNKNLPWEQTYAELAQAAHQKTSVGRNEEAISYLEAMLTIEEIDQEGKEDVLFRLISLAKQTKNQELEEKYTEQLGQDKLQQMLDGSRYGGEAQ